MKPTIHEIIVHVSRHYGLTKGEAMEIMRTPTHPKTMRDDFAKAALPMVMTAKLTSGKEVASMSYAMADYMLEERAK